jgi:hypothetical protein
MIITTGVLAKSLAIVMVPGNYQEPMLATVKQLAVLFVSDGFFIYWNI